MKSNLEDIRELKDLAVKILRLTRKIMKAQGHNPDYLDEHLGGLFYGLQNRIEKIQELELRADRRRKG